MSRRHRPTVDRRDGFVVLTLHEREVQVLGWVFGDLVRTLGAGGDLDGDPDDAELVVALDAVVRRLFPRAYLDPTEEDAERQWQELVHGDLVETRLSAATEVVRSLDAAAPVDGEPDAREILLGPELAERWLTVLNDARLALGTALNVTADWELGALDESDPAYALHALYAWMTELLGALLAATTR